ncbi:hypothetical protein A4D02_07330 [Niastella koreensis]|uniref:Lipopolysaccharide biosynthesis protein n=2 Tax=Niastella koreensis TaxID=354356 RepID=G8TJQ9_NIAKG|nr:hypothetical protein [Niastella koreensis]AEW01807.1 hypothetical protein Niako_5575 [Niastella koreensis GR20-10]OQP48516.1 hypothetical protein A4D02_07330 [Niastella koreensis]
MKQVKLISNPTDELDIAALFQQATAFLRQYGKLLLLVASIGLVAGLVRYWKTPNLYTSSIVLQPTILTEPEQIAVINNWSELIHKKERHLLAKQFNIDVSLVRKIESIKVEELQKFFAPQNYTAFTVTVIVRDTTILQPLQKGMLYALENSGYVKEKLASRKNILLSMIQTVQGEMNRLVKLQQTVETSFQQPGTSGGRLMLNVSDISTQFANLEERKLNYEAEFSFLSAVNVLQTFYTPANPTFPVLIKQLALGLCGGLFVGVLISFYLHYKKKPWNNV